MRKEIYYAIGTSERKPIVEKIVLSEEDEEFGEFVEESETFEDYVNYVLDETVAEYEQQLTRVICLKEDELDAILEKVKLKKLSDEK